MSKLDVVNIVTTDGDQRVSLKLPGVEVSQQSIIGGEYFLRMTREQAMALGRELLAELIGGSWRED